MKVTIDGVNYVPESPKVSDRSALSALDLRFDSDAGDNGTIRDYLYKLLETLWLEGEGFSGKRPFGNSGWEYDLFEPLIAAGYIEGSLDSSGGVDSVNCTQGSKFVLSLIAAAFYGVDETNE